MIKSLFELTKNDVSIAGGKGASLGEMIHTGIPVPPGFVILCDAFDRFKADEQFPEELAEAILQAFDELGTEFVAVRSSATAEDMADASWAGELETYLNTTRETLIDNVKKCWASLRTSRAVAYRHEKGMSDASVSVAVVVQKMVQSEIAGVTFTVHPVTKDPHQMIIEACWGLGEFIVGGIVTPDSYVINKTDGVLISTHLEDQKEMLVGGELGNEKRSVPENNIHQQKLDHRQIKEIADICSMIEKHYGFPCDIEWAYEQGKFFITQSRPITTLI